MKKTNVFLGFVLIGLLVVSLTSVPLQALQGAITVTSPNGGESWEVGSAYNITWTSTGIVGDVEIEYSTDNGTWWSTIVVSTDNDGSYTWTVPDNLSDNCLVRISGIDWDENPSDVSDATFSIIPSSSPTIVITYPNGGERLTVGSTHKITWNSTGNVGNVKIEYSSNNGNSWEKIVASWPNNGSYDWTVPDNPSDKCLVRVSEIDGEPSDVSNEVFTIVLPASITITSPNGGESWEAGSARKITWSNAGTVGDVKIEYSTDNGTNWTTIVVSTDNDGSYTWTVPDNPSDNCLVRITRIDGDEGISDVSDAAFSIVPSSSPFIAVHSPNGGERLTVGSTHKITWTSTGDVGNVKIEYSSNNGTSWTKIVASLFNNGSYDWTVSGNPSDKCLVRVSETDGEPSDVSNEVFSIVLPASITIISPNGSEKWKVGSSQKITWTSTGTVGDVKIEYSTDNGTNWTTIVVSTDNDGRYKWTVPDNPSDNCLVRISGIDEDENPSDVSDAVFSIVPLSSAAITVTSPNGGESLKVDSRHKITWTTSGIVENVKIEISSDNGRSWSTVVSSRSNDGVYSWTVPDSESSTCLVCISEASDGSPSDTSNGVFTIFAPTPPEIALNRTQLNFCALSPGTFTGSQFLWLNNRGGGTLNWSTDSGVPWLNCTPGSGTNAGVLTVSVNPAGLAVGNYTGTINVTDPDATNSPQALIVNLEVKSASKDLPPFGEFATPAQGSTVRSSIPVTGWVLDDVEVKSVKIYNGSGFIGDVVFVEGARPDIEQAYPGYPKNYQAGWGYMMLTHLLPNGGNGTYTLYAKATDSEGHQVILGSKTIFCDNANAVKPFGAIDTPTQGGSASGSSYVNWGWDLTPQPNYIPTDGSTINVYVDGVNLGHPTYNIYRSDIAALFPGFANSNGAAGYFYLDTTAYENGVHTIQWTVTDNAGNTDGIGSRYFTISNTGTNSRMQAQKAGTQFGSLDIHHVSQMPEDYLMPIWVKQGFKADILPQEILQDENGINRIVIKELERVEVYLSDQPSDRCSYSGYMKVGHRLMALPVGSTLDAERGIFYWQPGPGFLGHYLLVFVETSPNGTMMKKNIIVEIVPKTMNKSH